MAGHVGELKLLVKFLRNDSTMPSLGTSPGERVNSAPTSQFLELVDELPKIDGGEVCVPQIVKFEASIARLA